MHILVTAGNTQAPIDRVRCITNIFSGRTGTKLAVHGYERGHQITLLTSHPELVKELLPGSRDENRCQCFPYRTFEDLEKLMEENIVRRQQDAVIHCAAVNDFQSAGVFAPAPGTRFDPDRGTWESDRGSPRFQDRATGKIKSDEPEIWLRLVRSPKLVDRIRTDWKFRGLLVKFKLEVDVTPEQLLEIAEKSRRYSQADWMVANAYDGQLSSFFLGPFPAYQQVLRQDLPQRLFEVLENQYLEQNHG